MCCQLVLTRLWKQLKTILSSLCLRFKSVWFVFSQAKINHTWTVFTHVFYTLFGCSTDTNCSFILLSPTKFTQVLETSCQQHFKYPTLHTFAASPSSAERLHLRLFTCTLVCIFVRSLSSHLLCFLLHLDPPRLLPYHINICSTDEFCMYSYILDFRFA